ncbi:hypothetical protein [Alishewanella sp. SMS8]|uniref:hypothetical protein n=1 Tax=Alishewanella sp. SMS8 TaxID=2994676 RepID=UPI002741FDD2|nr:hypothetical protein [Alishewanella sp. SMS8]MDP5460467.1 hypothetical protein [Alishewanella sp. SMS8]
MKKEFVNTSILLAILFFAFAGRLAIDVFSSKTYDAEDNNKTLMRAASEINKNLPMTIDMDTVLVSTVGSGDTFRYLYKLINYHVDEIDLQDFNAGMAPRLFNWVCTSDTTAEFRKMKIKVVYSYVDFEDRKVVDIPIDTKECEQI